jgi:hypothetical protein
VLQQKSVVPSQDTERAVVDARDVKEAAEDERPAKKLKTEESNDAFTTSETHSKPKKQLGDDFDMFSESPGTVLHTGHIY